MKWLMQRAFLFTIGRMWFNYLRFIVLVGVGALWILLLPTVPLSLWLLFNFHTDVGLALALWGVAGMGWGIWLLSYLTRPTARRGRGVAAGAAVVLLLSAFILWQTPNGQPEAGSPITHQYSRGGRFNPWMLGNIIPEIEQMNVGFSVMPYLDRLFTWEQAQVVHPITMAIYQELEADPYFHALGSVMGWSFNELGGRPFDLGHYYLYVPQSAPSNTPMPALVFLHGSGGNFKPYIWILSELAEADGYVIIAPSFGFGNWGNEGGTEAVLAAVADAQQKVAIDSAHIYLAGLSNGGLGVSLTGAAAAQQFRGLIFISPVLATEVVGGDAFLAQWRERPILLISGAQDNRIPIGYIQEYVALWTAAEVGITSHIYPEEDHFLVFTQRQAVIQQIRDWLHNQL